MEVAFDTSYFDHFSVLGVRVTVRDFGTKIKNEQLGSVGINCSNLKDEKLNIKTLYEDTCQQIHFHTR